MNKLFTDGADLATEAEILSAASAIMRSRQKVQNGGRPLKLNNDQRFAARLMLGTGVSVNRVAKHFAVSWSTIRRLTP